MAEQNLTPPVPKKVEHRREHHGDVFIDHYEWLRDKESEEVLNYLKAEAEYTEAVTADQQPLRESIFNEIKGRTLLSDLTVPNRIGDWWYYSRMVPGGQYPVFYRYPALHEGDEVVPRRPSPPAKYSRVKSSSSTATNTPRTWSSSPSAASSLHVTASC